MRYRDAGVDLTRSDALKEKLGPMVRTTWGTGVRDLTGGFAGVMEWPAGSEPGAAPGARRDGVREARPPMLAATIDGVGTKLHLARAAGRVPAAAADLVYHGANDLLVHGARPLALLDYIAQARLDPDLVLGVVEGLSRACREVGAALVGGETAEMPDTYLPGVVDVAGCMIGTVSLDTYLDGRATRAGDAVLGLASSGLHSNGFSLARRVLETSGLGLASRLPTGAGESLGEALLRPHRWYGPALWPALERQRVHALAHITGGGLAGNLRRVLPPGLRAQVRADAWPRPAVFRWIVEAGAVPEEDARTALNLGIGMAVVCAAAEARALSGELERAGERVHEIGVIVPGERGVDWVEPA
jgi:phosphoribosylformylglycinamidine cyclo-ligase